jgi:hypothetical protein
MPSPEKAASVRDDSISSPSGVVLSGPAWEHGLEDLARFRALSRKGGGIVHSTIHGSSMGSSLPAGSRIRIRSGSDDGWKAGDVIAFLAGSRVMAHRIAVCGRSAKANGFFITQGDNNWLCDPPVHRSAVIGSVEIAAGEGEWRPVVEANVPRHKKWVAHASQMAMRGLLEANPSRAIRISQVISWMRMGPRVTLSIGRRLIRNVWN